jgi:general secretion pathway protein K
VLWTLVLIAFIVAHLTASGRTEVRIARNLVAGAVAEAGADGAIYTAIFNELDPNPDQRWPLNGPARELSVGNTRVMVQLEDEAGWINPSTASSALLEALLRTTGSDAETARRLAAAIGEWTGSALAAQPHDPAADYRAAGLDYKPPGEPLETLDELGRVIGMTPAILAAIRPHLTLFGPPVPNPATADPVVAAALTAAAQTASAPLPGNQAPPDLITVRITATAFGPENSRITRSAIVNVAARLPGGYTILAWSGSGFN